MTGVLVALMGVPDMAADAVFVRPGIPGKVGTAQPLVSNQERGLFEFPLNQSNAGWGRLSRNTHHLRLKRYTTNDRIC